MFKSIKFLALFLVTLFTLVSCEKETLIAEQDAVVTTQETPRGPVIEFSLYSYNSATGFTSPAACSFNVCDALPSGLSTFNTTLAGGTYSANGYVGHTYYSNPLWFNKNQTYFLVPEGTFPKNLLRINFATNYQWANKPTIKYNKTTKQWSVTGGTNYTSTIVSCSSAGQLPC